MSMATRQVSQGYGTLCFQISAEFVKGQAPAGSHIAGCSPVKLLPKGLSKGGRGGGLHHLGNAVQACMGWVVLKPSKACSAGTDLTPMDQVFAGMGAGLAGTVVACPTELIKCRLQGGDKVGFSLQRIAAMFSDFYCTLLAQEQMQRMACELNDCLNNTVLKPSMHKEPLPKSLMQTHQGISKLDHIVCRR